MRYLVGGKESGPHCYVSIGEYGGPIRPIATLGELVEFWEAGHRKDSGPKTPSLDSESATAEIHAIKKRLADIVADMPLGTKITVSVSKEPR